MIADEKLKYKNFFLTIFFLPVMLDFVATCLVWQFMYVPYYGAIPGIFGLLGLYDLRGLRWTMSKELAMPAVVIYLIWKTTGLNILLFFAGIIGIPKPYYEAAALDRLSSLQRFRHVILPFIKPILLYVGLISFINASASFEPIYMLTWGGPGNTTRVISMWLFENFFFFRKGGYASAGSMIMMFITIAFVFFVVFTLLRVTYERR